MLVDGNSFAWAFERSSVARSFTEVKPCASSFCGGSFHAFCRFSYSESQGQLAMCSPIAADVFRDKVHAR
eukprot:6192157-Pleurochrysis_carterae.AAC.1